MKTFVKVIVGNGIWLVPHVLCGVEFMSAINKMNSANHGDIVEWTDKEETAYNEVYWHKDVCKPL
jgi:hypothetical protein